MSRRRGDVVPSAAAWRHDALVAGAFSVLGVTLAVLAALNVRYLDFAAVPPHPFPDYRYFEGWTRWDTGWYYDIARNGYDFKGPNVQSNVAFFPAYPAAMRIVGAVVGDFLTAGVIVTFASGAIAAVLFRRWCAAILGRRQALTASALLLFAPFAFYLYGAVYSDALFLAAALGAFVLLERDRVLLAGVAGAVATAARPVGVAVVAALVIRVLERRGVFERGSLRERIRRVRVADAGVLLSLVGIGSFSALLWWRFRAPIAFAQVGGATGWDRQFDWHTISKRDYFDLMSTRPWTETHAALTVQAVLTVAALLLTVVVWRRIGRGYAVYNLVAVALPALNSKDLIGMGRYVLVAFPTYAAGAVLLDRLPRRWSIVAIGVTVAVSGVALAVMHSYFVRWYFFS